MVDESNCDVLGIPDYNIKPLGQITQDMRDGIITERADVIRAIITGMHLPDTIEIRQAVWYGYCVGLVAVYCGADGFPDDIGMHL